MSRSLVFLTCVLVGGVVLVLGALMLQWIAADDRAMDTRQAERIQSSIEGEMKVLAKRLVEESSELAKGVSQHRDESLREWLEQEPLALYRDASNPDVVDVDALINDLVPRLRLWGRDEQSRVALLVERLEAVGDRRIETAMSELRTQTAAARGRARGQRSSRLTSRLGWLLLGMAILLALALWRLVARPVEHTRRSVRRIAGGDLSTPVDVPRRGAREFQSLAADVETMRTQLKASTEGLEQEVARKTASLQQSLEERTRTLDELKVTQQRLVQAAKMAGLGTLAGGMAHEFNNLIGGVLGCIENALAESSQPLVKEDLGVARRTAKRATKLVQALLDVARPGDHIMGPVSLREIVDDVVRAARPTASREGVEIDWQPGEAAIVLGDAGQLHQVTLNLLTNALQHARKEGRVVVTTDESDRDAVVRVHDDGPGIDPDQRERIFEPFFTTRPEGTGLGLFVSYGIAERHGGSISLVEVPHGACFELRIPRRGTSDA